jgi:hypothetical protein
MPDRNMRFEALVDFEHNGSHYVKGLRYTARTKELQQQVMRWVFDRKVTHIRNAPTRGSVKGKGEVK